MWKIGAPRVEISAKSVYVRYMSKDDPSPRTIGWTIRGITGGCPITRPNSTELLRNREDLKEGDLIWVQQLFGIGEYTVELDEAGFYGRNESNTAILKFGEDAQNPCWSSPGQINLKALKKLVITRDEP